MFTVYLFILIIIIIFIITHSGKNNHVKADRQEKTQKSEKRNWEKNRRKSNKEDRVLDGVLCYLYSKQMLDWTNLKT